MNIEEIQKGLETAFIDKDIISNIEFRPKFLYNDHKSGKKILSEIEKELKTCKSFYISVAFIKDNILQSLKTVLKELEEKQIPGKILTTDYFKLTSPKALETLNNLSNIKLKMFMTNDDRNGFHTKGYIFKQENIFHIIIGSSNITDRALTTNKEWNIKLLSTPDGEILENISDEFNELWNSPNSLDINDCYNNYSEKFKLKSEKDKLFREYIKNYELSYAADSKTFYTLSPNQMQKTFIENFKALIENGEHKGLLVSATGTGKTYASAFALREINPNKILYIVHREQIAKQSITSFKKIFSGLGKKFGLLSGNSKDYSADYLFATMQTMSKPEIMNKFKKNEFDIILIDEVHRAGAYSYDKIMNYFEPKFWLGMTASPERTDGFNIFNLFDNNLIHEIRLEQALEENLLCPFHYYGISDLTINGQIFDENSNEKCFSMLVSDERVKHILNQINYYGYSGNRVKGLIFCSSKKEAICLSEKFNQKGYKTVALTGDDSIEYREECIEKLVSDNIDEKLDYIFTIDIFNEGVDIPEINQVVMLRPTQSPIIFIQQLGRGLRKHSDKEYVVIIDFIANYNNNYMIPVALSDDRSYNKDNMRRFLLEGNNILPGESTIHFDAIAAKRIFNSIDSVRFDQVKFIKEKYINLKNRLGKIPSLIDFDNFDSIDPLMIFANSTLGSYHKFLSKFEADYKISLNNEQELLIEFISKKFASGKRPHELLLIKSLLDGSNCIFEDFKNNYPKIRIDKKAKENIIKILTNDFGDSLKRYKSCVLIKKNNNDYCISDYFKALIDDSNFKNQILELIQFALMRNQKKYSKLYKNSPFQLYEKYTYEDVVRLLNWSPAINPGIIGGYRFDEQTKTYPVFINYKKNEDISNNIKYEDRFINQKKLIAISKHDKTLKSPEVQTALNARDNGIDMDLFVRKDKNDKVSKEFYYLGRIFANGECKEIKISNTDKKAVEITYDLETEVRSDIYDYIIS